MKSEKPRHPHKMEDLFPDEFYAELKRCPIAYLASGGVENHGPHNALGMDGFTGYDVAVRAAEISGGLVYPPVWLGDCALDWNALQTTGQELYRPSVWHSRSFMLAFFDETFWNFERLGFRVCACVPGHAGNWLALEQYFKERGDRYGKMKILHFRLWDNNFAFDFAREELDHGGIWESSLISALRPGYCDPRRTQMDLGVFPPEVKMQWRPDRLPPEKITPDRVAIYLDRSVRKIAAAAAAALRETTT